MPPSVASFGYANGAPPEADVVIDVRGLSHDLSRREVSNIRTQISDALGQGQSVAIGCEYGQHRSVVLANECAKALHLTPTHRDKISKPRESRRQASAALTKALHTIVNYRR